MNISEGLSAYRVSRRNTGVHDKTVGVSMQNPDTGMACWTGLQYWLEYRAGEKSCLIMFCDRKAFLNGGTSGDKRHLLAPRIFTKWVKNWSLHPGILVFMCWEFKLYQLPLNNINIWSFVLSVVTTWYPSSTWGTARLRNNYEISTFVNIRYSVI